MSLSGFPHVPATTEPKTQTWSDSFEGYHGREGICQSSSRLNTNSTKPHAEMLVGWSTGSLPRRAECHCREGQLAASVRSLLSWVVLNQTDRLGSEVALEKLFL